MERDHNFYLNKTKSYGLQSIEYFGGIFTLNILENVEGLKRLLGWIVMKKYPYMAT